MQHNFINDAQQALIRGGDALFGTLPVIITRIIHDEEWKTQQRQDGETFASFREFVEYKLWWGLETPYDDILTFCKKDADCIRLLEEQRGELGAVGSNQYAEGVSNRNTKAKGGTNLDYTKRRLKRDRPDLYEKVISGELSANAAAIEAGFRKPTTSLRTPEGALDAVTVALKADSRVAAICELLVALKPSEFQAVRTWLASSRAA